MTNPEAVEAAILAISDYTQNIYIGDSDFGGYNRFSMDAVYQETGIANFADRYGVNIVNLSHTQRKEIKFRYRGHDFSLELPRLLIDEVDFLITMPVPKIYNNTGVSLSFKNQWGCIPEPNDRLQLHPYFQHVILEVNKAVRTRVAILDGKFGLNRNGPLPRCSGGVKLGIGRERSRRSCFIWLGVDADSIGEDRSLTLCEENGNDFGAKPDCV